MDEGIKKVTDGVNELFDYIDAGGGGTGGELPADVVRAETETPFVSNDHIVCGVESTKNKIYDSGVSISSLQPKLTAGTGVHLENNVISVETYADDVNYSNNDYPTVGDALDNLYSSKLDTSAIQDRGSDMLWGWNNSLFQSPEIVHFYKIGDLIFVHLVFSTIKDVESTGQYPLCTLAAPAQHEHSIACAALNISTGTITTTGATLLPSGEIQMRLVKGSASSNYKFDLNFFYCTDH